MSDSVLFRRTSSSYIKTQFYMFKIIALPHLQKQQLEIKHEQNEFSAPP